jgi:proline iminopeptidase
MKQILVFITLYLTVLFASGQTIYTKPFGNAKDEPIIFIHGGPSGNSTLFEATTAQRLADKGFYVIVYDRRGEGRSADTSAKFTYNEAFDDLITLLKEYNIEKVNIIGHSFGGLVATLFADRFPQKVKSLILVGALFSQQETYNHILASVKLIYKNNGDTSNLKRVKEIENMDKTSAEYRKSCYELAGENNFFKMPIATKQADSLRHQYDITFSKSNIRNQNAPTLFYKNETLRNIDTKLELKRLKKQIEIYAIYGKQDKIFSKQQMNEIKELVGEQNFKLIDNCSHYLFADQQLAFIDSITKWTRNKNYRQHSIYEKGGGRK